MTIRRQAREPPKLPARETLGAFVRRRRKAEGMTQRQLSELAGVGPRAVVELERDKTTMRMDVANAVLRVFGKELGVVEGTREQEDE